MNFPGIAKLPNLKIPGLRVGAPTPVLIRSASRLHCTFIYVGTEVSKMFSDFSCPLVGETDIQPLSTRKKNLF